MIKKSVGGKIVTVQANTELITWQNCGYESGVNSIVLSGFFVKNEDTKDIYVKINEGSEMLLQPDEAYSLDGLTDVVSCVIVTPATIRWGGLR